MFNRSAIYTVHENTDLADPADRLILVREGFSFRALLFAPVWLLVHRLWLALGVYVLLMAEAQRLWDALGAPEVALLVLQCMAQLLLGFYANDLRRDGLARRGYRETGVVGGDSLMQAQRRALELAA